MNNSIIFNNNDISTVPNVKIHNFNATDLPSRDVQIHKIARSSKSVITSSEYTQKQITVQGHTNTTNRTDAEVAVTAIKALLQAQNGDLIVQQSGGDIKYTATMNEFNISWGGTKAIFEIIFIASTPVGTSTTPELLANLNVTTQSGSATFAVSGSFSIEPLITVTVNSVTGGTGSIYVINAVNNQGIEIVSTFKAGDVVEIDSEALSVRINGGEHDFLGMFPTFPAGMQQVAYSDSFTTRNIDLTLTAKTRIV